MSIVTVQCPRCNFTYNLISDQSMNRTLKQNSMYWPVYVQTCADYFGYFPDEMHEEFKLMFNGKDSKLVPGAKVGGTTTKMTTREFTQYLERIKIWAGTHGIQLPDTEE